MQTKHLMVVGGGLVGAAIAYGAARSGALVTLLDQGDIAHRASRGNFGLLWVQGKGGKSTAYASWTRDAVKLWPALAQELLDLTGVDVALQQAGGYWIGFSEAEMEARAISLSKINGAAGGIPFEIMDRQALKQHLPAIGQTVAGGSYCPVDGHANPLKLMHAFHAGLVALGATVISSVDICNIDHSKDSGIFELTSREGKKWRSPRIVIAAGLGCETLAAQVGLTAPVLPKRGQVLITERLKPFIDLPTNKVRQTNEGSVQLGSSTEEVGHDDSTTVDSIEGIAKKSIATFPVLSSARLVRAWGALRVMTPDGLPIYQQSLRCPGAFVATSHSGVTLAAAHAYELGPWMADIEPAPGHIGEFSGERFSTASRSIKNARA